MSFPTKYNLSFSKKIIWNKRIISGIRKNTSKNLQRGDYGGNGKFRT